TARTHRVLATRRVEAVLRSVLAISLASLRADGRLLIEWAFGAILCQTALLGRRSSRGSVDACVGNGNVPVHGLGGLDCARVSSGAGCCGGTAARALRGVARRVGGNRWHRGEVDRRRTDADVHLADSSVGMRGGDSAGNRSAQSPGCRAAVGPGRYVD